MELKECTLHCDEMDKDFDVIVYGEAGRPTVVFPEGDASCTSWENGGMVEALSEFVEDGRIQLFCFDSVDSEGWYAHGARNSYRLGSLMPYLDYVRSGLLPFVSAHAASQDLPLVAGVGIGALNAALVMLRHPELFGGLLALSGTYDVRAFTDDVTEEWLSLSPVDLVRSLSPRGKCAGLLRKRPMAFVCGRHESESGIETQRALDALFAEKNLGATFEYWGYDVSHDWSWWQEEARQLLPCLLEGSGLAERSQIARISSAQADVKHAEDLLAQQRDELSAARDALSVAVEAVKGTSKRLEAEGRSVARHVARADELAAAARDAWSEHDRALEELAALTRRADEAQAAADEAAGIQSSAEWIAGEAKEAVEQAVANERSAHERVERAEAGLKDAELACAAAAKALDDVRGGAKAGRGATTKTKRDATAKATGRRTTAKPAARKPTKSR